MQSFFCNLKNGLFSETYPLIYGNPRSFLICKFIICEPIFWSPYLSHITRSTCISETFPNSQEFLHSSSELIPQVSKCLPFCGRGSSNFFLFSQINALHTPHFIDFLRKVGIREIALANLLF